MLDLDARLDQQDAMTDHAKGLLITTLGVLFLVPDALFIRLIAADALTTAFWRLSVAGSLLLVFVLVRMGPGALQPVLRAGPPAWAYMVLFGLSSMGFVLAVSLTSVAHVVFIVAAMPAFAALFSRIWLGERLTRRMALTMLGVAAGLVILLQGSHGSATADWRGDLVALGVAACFAAAMTAVRKVRHISMLPAAPIAMLGGALCLAPFTSPGAAFASSGALILAYGGFIAVSGGLMVLGPRYISSAEVSLLILLEAVLAPLLVWAVIGETPGGWALLGGGVVIAVLLASNLIALRKARQQSIQVGKARALRRA
ncbi:MAG: DMT family transporter [Roseinatronobacter sp.]